MKIETRNLWEIVREQVSKPTEIEENIPTETAKTKTKENPKGADFDIEISLLKSKLKELQKERRNILDSYKYKHSRPIDRAYMIRPINKEIEDLEKKLEKTIQTKS